MRTTKARKSDGSTDAVKSTYEKAWSATRDRLETWIARDEHISTILARMGRLSFPGHRENFWRKQPTASSLGRRVLEAHDVDSVDDANPYYPAVIDGRYSVGSAFNAMQYLGGTTRPEVNVVLELGSGWSANLFGLYLFLGNARSHSIRYVGAEFTDAGRECGELLAKHDGRIDYTAVAFDWTKPDLSFLGELPGPVNVLAFSHHSIEQVERIDPDVYAQLARYADSARVVHCEPVGWQRDPELVRRRLDNDRDFFHRIARDLGLSRDGTRVPRTKYDVTTTEAQLRGAAWWSWNRRYNLDLLTHVDQVDLLRVRRTLFDYGSMSNPFNPSTLVDLDVRTGQP